MRRITRLRQLGFAVFSLIACARLGVAQSAATLAHAYCSASMGGKMYFAAAFSAPFEKDPRGAEPSYHTMVTWGRAFADYIEQKYGPGPASGQCVLATSFEQAQAGVKGGMASAKRLGRPVVETDWVHKSAVPPGAAAPPAQAAAASSAQTPPNASAQGTTMQAVCWSDLNAPVIYVSQVFDTRRGRPDQGEDVFSSVSNEFHQYLKGRYDYKTSATRGAHCAGQMSQAGTSAQRNRIMTEFATGKRVVELEWDFSPDTTVVRGTQSLDGGYCVSPGATGTVYTAGPFDLKGRMSTHDWNRGFSQFLASKFALKGDAECQIGMPQVRAQRWFSFHVQGARAGNKKVVETGWELGSAAAPTSQAAQPNAPNETRPAAPAATPSQQVRAFATKEVPEIMAYCQNDKVLRALNCQMVQRAIYNYRMAHAADATPEPFAVLLTGDKLDCSGCVDGRLTGWAKQQASAASLTQVVAECVGQRIVPLFQAKPYANRIKEAYDAALAACKR
jgi:hypothetical protein